MIQDVGKLCLILGLFFGFMLGARPLSTPDEGRYAEIPREMVESGDYVTPRLNGFKYLEKPPLMYWAEAFIIKNFGLDEFALRLLPFILGILGCVWVFLLTYSLFGRTEAWSSALIMGSSLLYYGHTRLLILDLGVSFFLSLSLLSFLKASRCVSLSQQNKWLIGFYGGAALAVMTKGLIGMVIPGAIILLWTLIWKQWNILKLAFKPWGILLFLAITAPWHILVSLQNPEFPYFYFIHEHFVRFSALEHRRTQEWWFFSVILLGGLFPWTAFLVQSIKNGKEKFPRDIYRFLWVWIGFIFIFFSCSNSKLISYILPAFPPLSIILGVYIGRIWHKNKNELGFVWGIQAYSLINILLVLAFPLVMAKDYLFPLFKEHKILCEFILLILILGTFLSRYFVNKGRPRQALICLFLLSITLFSNISLFWTYIDKRTTKVLALTILETKKPQDKVIAYKKYFQDLPVYLNQKVLLVDWKGELDFGITQEKDSPLILSIEKFRELWQSNEKIYAVMRESDYKELYARYPKKTFFLKSVSDKVLVTNRLE